MPVVYVVLTVFSWCFMYMLGFKLTYFVIGDMEVAKLVTSLLVTLAIGGLWYDTLKDHQAGEGDS